MVAKRRAVLRGPSRQTRKSARKAAAQMERRQTIVQLSSVARKRAIVPPKLHTTAEAMTRKMPARSTDGASRGKAAAGEAAAGGALDTKQSPKQRFVGRPTHLCRGCFA